MSFTLPLDAVAKQYDFRLAVYVAWNNKKKPQQHLFQGAHLTKVSVGPHNGAIGKLIMTENGSDGVPRAKGFSVAAGQPNNALSLNNIIVPPIFGARASTFSHRRHTVGGCCKVGLGLWRHTHTPSVRPRPRLLSVRLSKRIAWRRKSAGLAIVFNKTP